MKLRFKNSRNKIGYIFALPYIIHFSIFVAFPIVFSFLLVFHRWDIISPMKWVGLNNFVRLSQDLIFFKSIGNTFIFLIIHIPLQIIVALALAEFLNQKIRFRGFFRASYFLPVVVSGVVITILWQQLYAQDSGVLNSLLSKIGLIKLPWLTSSKLAMPSIAIMATWKNVGLYIILFLVGLQSVPKYMYEAADIEGASHWEKFRHITLPMINPTMILVVILSTIGGFSLFIEPYIMTDGGPMNSTLSAMLYIYKQAFSFYHMGYAATLGFFFALVVFSIVLIQKKVIEKDVGY
ncbi:sugar ABC transporter permease [candidate division KSB1 bacterium]|nr:sugar ABC transporter permease [candidate division KSB1 bacterium]MBL7093670.1 sugar ABC transporter permease [candidate division KSB1 bacterium]